MKVSKRNNLSTVLPLKILLHLDGTMIITLISLLNTEIDIMKTFNSLSMSLPEIILKFSMKASNQSMMILCITLKGIKKYASLKEWTSTHAISSKLLTIWREDRELTSSMLQIKHHYDLIA